MDFLELNAGMLRIVTPKAIGSTSLPADLFWQPLEEFAKRGGEK